MIPREAHPSLVMEEKKLKELKEFSRLLVISLGCIYNCLKFFA